MRYNSTIASDRKQQVCSGQRGDKVRTYRFQDNVVKDHNSGKQAPCDKVMLGKFDLLWTTKTKE
jgi:protein subunit release factor A